MSINGTGETVQLIKSLPYKHKSMIFFLKKNVIVIPMLGNQRQADPWGLVVSKRPYFKNQGGWLQRNDTRSWPLAPYSGSPTWTYTDTSKQIHKESESVILRVVLRHELFLSSKQAKQYSRSLHIVSVAFPRGSASMPGVLWLFFPCADACQVFEWCSPHSWMLFRHSSGYVHMVICAYSTMLGAWIGRGLTYLNAGQMPFTLKEK